MTDRPTQSAAQLARLVTDRATAQRIADRLAEDLDPDTCAVSFFEQGSDWVAEAVFTGAQARHRIEQLMAEFAPGANVAIENVTERDWVAKSLEGLAPVRAGRFVVHGAHDRGRVRPNQIGVEIEAALAFGTGHHGTTRGCLLAFEALRKRSAPPRRWRILDIGTGTGVLAIAAARALRTNVLASDIDPVAVSVAAANAKLNRAGALFQGFTAAGADAARFRAGGRYDLVFANILEAPLRRLSRPLSALMAPNGHIVLSGLMPAHAGGVVAAYRRQGLALQARLLIDGWVTLTMRR